MDPEDRLVFLNANAYEVELKTVPIPIPGDERSETEHLLSSKYVALLDVQEEKKELNKDFNVRIKEIKFEMDVMSAELRTGTRMVKTKVFTVLNDDTGMLEDFTLDGQLIGSRRAPRNHQRRMRANNEE